MDNLPDLDSFFTISQEKIDFFWQNGFVVLKNVLDKNEIIAYRDEIKKITLERNRNKEKEFGGHFIKH